MASHRFELVGGHPVLDFLNTIHDWTARRGHDYLPAWDDVVRFGQAVGLVSPAEANRLRRQSAGSELQGLRRQRARLERVLGAVVGKRPPAVGDLAGLASTSAEAAGHVRLVPVRRGRVRRLVDPAGAGPRLVRFRLAESATELLTSDRMGRVSRCPACGWFFLDQSKNRSRRWCSMATCGASAKSKRYYWRTRPRRARI